MNNQIIMILIKIDDITPRPNNLASLYFQTVNNKQRFLTTKNSFEVTSTVQIREQQNAGKFD